MAPTIRRLVIAFFFLLRTVSFTAANEPSTDLAQDANNKGITEVEEQSRENRYVKLTMDSVDDVACSHCNSLSEVSRVNQLIFTINSHYE